MSVARAVFCALPPLLIVALHLAGFNFVVPLTDSMEPAVPRYSLVLTAPPWLVEPGVGDVVLYRLELAGTYLVLHRVVGATERGFVTKGDNRAFADPWRIRRGDVVGVAVLVIPWLGLVLLVLRPAALLALLWLAAFLLTRRIVEAVLARRSSRCYTKRPAS